MELKAENIRPNDEKVEEESGMVVPTTPEACKETMEKINKFVKDVSGSCRQTEPGVERARPTEANTPFFDCVQSMWSNLKLINV